MSDREVKIGKKKIGENTEVSFSLKTMFWIMGIVISLFSFLFTLSYINIKKDVESYKKSTQENIDTKLDALENKHEQILKDMGDIKTNVGIILDRTSGARNTAVVPTINGEKITPENNKPPQ